MPIPSSVMMADVDGFCLNYFSMNKIRQFSVGKTKSYLFGCIFQYGCKRCIGRYAQSMIMIVINMNIIRLTYRISYTLNGNFGSEVNVILNVTLPPPPPLELAADESPEIESDL